MKKIKIQNQPFGPFPTMIIGADVNGKPNYVTVGACGVVSLKPVLYVSLKSTHYTTPGVKENGYFSVNIPPVSMVEQQTIVELCQEKQSISQAYLLPSMTNREEHQ